MIKTECLQCGKTLLVNSIHEGDGYFFGYDTDYYGDTVDDQRDPHQVIGYYCKRCGSFLKAEAEKIGWENVEDGKH